jgi:hypothetical protein
MNQCILFEDIFDVKALNENGKKFERGMQTWACYSFVPLSGVPIRQLNSL